MRSVKEGKYTIRIYDKDVLKKINDSYKEMSSFFGSINSFLTRCLELGLVEIRNQLSLDSGDKTIQYLDKINSISKQLNIISKALKEKTVDDIVKGEIEKRSSSCLYHMVLNLSKGTPLSQKEIEEGLYDFMPERFQEEMLDLMEKMR